MSGSITVARHKTQMRAFLLPIGGAVWLACGSVVTATRYATIRPEQGTVHYQPGDRNDEVTWDTWNALEGLAKATRGERPRPSARR